jgi:Flp pilus assembly protein TadG
MIVRSSSRAQRNFRRRLGADDRGAIVVFMAISLFVMFGAAGLAIDLGRGYIGQVRLARAVDASALAAARSLRQGQAVALTNGQAVAQANGVVNGAGGVSLGWAFGVNAQGENTVTVTANQPVSTTFMRLFGHTQMIVAAAATAAVPPVDLILVLDQSGSLAQAGAWGSLQSAARTFVQYFDDSIDQVGLVSFQLRATDRVQMAGNFTNSVMSAINAMQSAGDTNVGEGLLLAQSQVLGFNSRPRAAKVVVFFTDGRPTAFRGNLGGQDRMLAVYTTGNRIRGYFNNPNSLPTDQLATADGCVNFFSCFGYNENAVRATGQALGLQQANSMRSQGVLVYSIGLGNPGAGNPLLVPDLNYLRQIANEAGVIDPNQPQGRMFFAPSAAQLQLVFDQVAQDLFVRLAS